MDGQHMNPVFPAPLGGKTPFLVESLGTCQRSVGDNGGALNSIFLIYITVFLHLSWSSEQKLVLSSVL